MHEVSLFGDRVVGFFCGRSDGNHQTKPPVEGNIRRIDQVREHLGARRVILPNISHSSAIMSVDADNGLMELWPDLKVWKTAELADGLITTDSNVAIAIANADCPVGVLYHRSKQWLCLLHLGLKCLLISPNILEQAVAKAPVSSLVELQFEFGFGIGSCCFGYNSDHEHLAKVRQICPVASNGAVQRGPRQGQPSINLPLLISQLARRHLRGGTCRVIQGGSQCTACRRDIPSYSHVWSEQVISQRGYRNLFVVKLAP
ncbi:MAG: laccase domain-containing protein [Candidatus Vogelbacteria bacterium]|nr:laccase domain-containing protein [Candidatus Vogelbacteria bacterium]